MIVDVVMLGGVAAFVWYEARAKRRGIGGSVYGPALLVSVASILIIADPTRHVLQDLQLIGAPMYKPHCRVETFACLSIIGWFFTVFCTYVGFALFFGGVIWNSNIVDRIVKQWKDLRGTTNWN